MAVIKATHRIIVILLGDEIPANLVGGLGEPNLPHRAGIGGGIAGESQFHFAFGIEGARGAVIRHIAHAHLNGGRGFDRSLGQTSQRQGQQQSKTGSDEGVGDFHEVFVD